MRYLIATTVLLLMASTAAAQPDDRKWEVAITAGSTSGNDFASGTGTLPPTPLPFVDTIFNQTLRTDNFPSWYLAGGAEYLNGARAFRFRGMTPLDPMLTTGSAERRGGPGIGLRVSRELASRFRAEAGLEFRRVRLELTPLASEQLEASRAAFAAFFEQFEFTAVSSTVSAEAATAGEILATGGISVDLRRSGRAMPFIAIGAGVLSRVGPSPQVRLRGEYIVTPFRSLLVPSVFHEFSIIQSDNVRVTYKTPNHALVGVLRGGLRYALSPRLSATIEGRAQLAENGLRIVVDAAPTTGPTHPQVSVSSSLGFATWDLNFGSEPSDHQSLSGPPLREFTTFTSRGWHQRFGITAGLGVRF